jgi:hypothetical protein
MVTHIFATGWLHEFILPLMATKKLNCYHMKNEPLIIERTFKKRI